MPRRNKSAPKVGRDLNIESLQDTSKFASKQQSIGASVTIGAGASGSFSASQSTVKSDFASVTQQSGIRAGDGGFDVEKDAQSVTINALHWLRKIEPLRDWSNSRERLAAPIETWVLKIPDTPYWLKLHLSSSSGATSKYHAGALAYSEKHQRIVDLFHQIVYSVKLEPIMPIDTSPLVKEIR